LYKELLNKCEFGQTHYVQPPKRSPTKFSLPFLDIPKSFYKFKILHYFLRIKSIEKQLKKLAAQCRPNLAWGHSPPAWRPATRDRPKGWLGLGLAARSSRGGGTRARVVASGPGALAAWSPPAVVCSPTTRWWLAGGKVLSASSWGPPGGPGQ
jgi:hypothetical protein